MILINCIPLIHPLISIKQWFSVFIKVKKISASLSTVLSKSTAQWLIMPVVVREHFQMRPHELQCARPPCPSPTPSVYSKSCPLSRWCHPTISFFCAQCFPTSGSFPISQLFTWGGRSIGVSASASILPMNTQDWSPLGWTGWISLQSKGLSRVFSNTTVQKHQFFGAQLSLQCNSHIHTWPLEKA